MSRSEQKNKHRDGDGGGGCCGGCAGCLVLLAAGAIVFGMLVLTPYLRERNWTKEGIEERFHDLKVRIERIVEEFIRKVKDSAEHPSHARENAQDFGEQVKHAAAETRESISGGAVSEPEIAPAPDRRGKAEEPAVLPGAETPNLESELIED